MFLPIIAHYDCRDSPVNRSYYGQIRGSQQDGSECLIQNLFLPKVFELGIFYII